ncbi:MAG: phasin family protein [Acidobacteriota bacterium]
MSDTKTQEERSGLREEVAASANKIWLAGLGALATVEEEGGKLFKSLVEKGETFESRGRNAVSQGAEELRDQVDETVGKAKGSARDLFGDLSKTVDDRVASALHRLGVPTRDEIQTLTSRVEELTSKIDGLASAPAKAAKKPAARKTASRATKKATEKA